MMRACNVASRKRSFSTDRRSRLESSQHPPVEETHEKIVGDYLRHGTRRIIIFRLKLEQRMKENNMAELSLKSNE